MFRSTKESGSAPMRQPSPVKIPACIHAWMLATIIGLGTIALYWPATHHDFVVYDDRVYVTSNPQVQNGLTVENLKWAFTHPVCGNWHPITVLSHMLDCQLYGLQPWGHHLTNVLLHALDAALVFLLLLRLTGALWRSAAVAALFAWHPLHVESVAWVAERKDVLSACLGFLSLLLYVRYAQGQRTGNDESKAELPGSCNTPYRSPLYWLNWFCFALGLMSKPMLVTWPFVMLLLDYWPLNRFKPGTWRLLVIEKIPGFILAAAGSIIAMVVQTQTGAADAMKGMPMIVRCENAVVSYCRYLCKTFWPRDLAVFYPHPGYLPIMWVLLASVFLCAVSAYAWINRKRYPFLLTGWFWFVGTLVPVIGIVQVGAQAMADRYTYIPSVGLFVVATLGLYELLDGWRHRAKVLSLAGATSLALCVVLTRQQLGYWQNSETLFQHALNVTQNNFVARVNLAVTLRDENRNDEAIKQFQVAARLKPNYVEARNDLGNLLAQQGRTNEAIIEFQDILRLRPDYAEAHCSLGRVLANEGRSDDALAQYQEAIRLKPDYADAHYCLGHLLAGKGQTDAAIGQFQEAERAKSEDARVYFELGNLLAEKGRNNDAIHQFQEVIRLKPVFSGAHNFLGKLLAAKGQLNEAAIQFQEAVRLTPDDFEAHNNLGNVLAIKGQVDAAAAQFQESIRLKPDYADAHFNFGNLLANAGQTGPAITQFQEVIRLNPNDAEARNHLGLLLEKSGRMNEAIGQFQEAVRLRPDYAEARTNLAHALEIKARNPKAGSQN